MFLRSLFSSVSTRAICTNYTGRFIWPQSHDKFYLGDHLYLSWDGGSKADCTNSTTASWNIRLQDSIDTNERSFKLKYCSRNFTFNDESRREWYWHAVDSDPDCVQTLVSCFYPEIPVDTKAATYVAIGIRDAVGTSPATTVSSGPFTILGSTNPTKTPSTTPTPSESGTGTSTTSPIAAESPSTAPAAGGVSVGAIAGSVVGGIIILLCLSGLVWILRRKRHAKQTFERAAAAHAEGTAYWKPELDGGAIPPLVRSGVELDSKAVNLGELDGKEKVPMEKTGVELDSKTVSSGDLDGGHRLVGADTAAPSQDKTVRIDVTPMVELGEGRPTGGRDGMETASLAPSLD